MAKQHIYLCSLHLLVEITQCDLESLPKVRKQLRTCIYSGDSIHSNKMIDYLSTVLDEPHHPLTLPQLLRKQMWPTHPSEPVEVVVLTNLSDGVPAPGI